MYGKLVTSAVFALLLASPTMAATPVPVASSHTKAISHVSSHMNKKTMHHVRRKKVSMVSSKSGHSEVHALNALQAAGYRQLNDLHAKGADFVGTARKAGKSYDVTVMPSGAIKATLA
jgi:hypothetical protein